VKPGRGLGLKKEIFSDCDLRNLRSVEDGTGGCRAGRIAAGEAIAINSYREIISSRVVVMCFCEVEIFLKLGLDAKM
jgi:hypothetical protein